MSDQMMQDECQWALFDAAARLEEAANWCGSLQDPVMRGRIEAARDPVLALLKEWEQRYAQ